MLELFTKKPVFQGNDDIDQLDVIYRFLGTPSPDIWPAIVDMPWYEFGRLDTKSGQRPSDIEINESRPSGRVEYRHTSSRLQCCIVIILGLLKVGLETSTGVITIFRLVKQFKPSYNLKCICVSSAIMII